jgi:hypothetical protein
MLWAVFDDPRRGGVRLLDLHRVLRFWGTVIMREHDCGLGADREVAHEQVVSLRAAQHPAGAVCVEDDGKRPGDTGRLHQSKGDLAPGPGVEPDVLDDHVRLVDRGSLHTLENLPGVGWAELIDEWRLGCCVRELLGGCLQHDGLLLC